MDVDYTGAACDGYLPRVNGNMLSNYVNKSVLILAELMSIDNLKMKIRCCDGSIIMCNLSEAITQHLAGGTKVQIEGVPKSKNTVQISDFIVLQDLNDDFHMDIYNETVKMLAETEQHNTYLVRNVEEHWGSCNEKEIDFVDELDRLSTNNASNGNANAKGGQGAEHEDTFF